MFTHLSLLATMLPSYCFALTMFLLKIILASKKLLKIFQKTEIKKVLKLLQNLISTSESDENDLPSWCCKTKARFLKEGKIFDKIPASMIFIGRLEFLPTKNPPFVHLHCVLELFFNYINAECVSAFDSLRFSLV